MRKRELWGDVKMIYGKGLYLREVVKEDIDRAYELCVNDDVLKYDGGYTSFASKEYIKENYKYFQMKSKKNYAIVNTKGIMVGIISYRKSNYVSDVYYIGICIGRKYWGMAKIALKPCLDISLKIKKLIR